MGDCLLKAPIEHEPLRKNRFIYRFPTDLGISEWTIASGKRPSIKQGSTEIQFLNTSTYVAGRYNWEWIRLCSESASWRQGYAAGYKRDVELELLDPSDVVVQKWILRNCWISDCDYGNLAYNDDSIADITATLVMDYAILCY